MIDVGRRAFLILIGPDCAGSPVSSPVLIGLNMILTHTLADVAGEIRRGEALCHPHDDALALSAERRWLRMLTSNERSHLGDRGERTAVDDRDNRDPPFSREPLEGCD